MAEKRDNSGVMFANDRKTESKHPDRKGSATIDGREYWVSGWIKDGQNGKFLSLAFTPKEQRTQERPREQRSYADERPAPARRAPARADMDDEIPF